MLMTDLHIHSTFSDGKLPIPALIDLYGSRGFGAIAITDHLCEEKGVIGRAAHYIGHSLTRASFPIYMEILKSEAQRAWSKYRMVVIPGIELSKNSISNHRSAHILGLGVSKFIPADGDIVDLTHSIRSQGGIAIAAHPVSTRKWEKQTYHLWDRKDELRKHFDAWEVASGPYLFDEVLRANLPKVASSDLHHPRQLHSWKTVFECERNPEAILDAVRKQKLSFKFYNMEADYDLGNWINSYDLDNSYLSDSLRPVVSVEAL